MKKLLLFLTIGLSALFFNACSNNEKSIEIPFDVAQNLSNKKFDTILAIKSSEKTYYFSKNDNVFTHCISNDEIKTTKSEDSTIGIIVGFFLIFVWIILMLI